MSEIIIGSEKEFLKITVIGKTYPNCFDRWDGGWLNSKIDLCLGRFKGSVDAYLRIDEFETFLKGLRKLYKKLEGTATYSSMEEWLSIDIKHVDSLGHFSAGIIMKDKPGGRNSISGVIMIDQTYLTEIIKGIKTMLAKVKLKK